MVHHRFALEMFFWSLLLLHCIGLIVGQMHVIQSVLDPCANNSLIQLLQYVCLQNLFNVFVYIVYVFFFFLKSKMYKCMHTNRTKHYLPCMATDKSTELKLVAESSLSELLNFLPFLNGPLLRFIRFCDKCSPHKFEPPCVYGILSNAIPCK